MKNVDVVEAEHWLQQALTQFRILGDPNGLTVALSQMAATLDYDGRFKESLAFYEETVQRYLVFYSLTAISVFRHFNCRREEYFLISF